MKVRFQNKIAFNGSNIILYGIILLLLIGCRSRREVVIDSETAEPAGKMELIALLEERTQKFKTLKIKKANIDVLINSVSNNVKGNIAIYRDSIIAVSILPALGFEAFRIMCTKDSVIAINRVDKSYSATSFENYRNRYNIPVGFSDIQALFSNELFYYNADNSEMYFKSKFKEKKEKILYLIDAYNGGKRISSQSMLLDSKQHVLESVSVTDYDTGMNMMLTYSGFIVDGGWPFPGYISLNIFGKKYKISVKMQYGQIVFNEPIRLEFKVPSNYKKEDF